MTRPSVLLIANFFSSITGAKGVSEEIACNLRTSSNWNVITASPYPGRIRRLADFIFTIITKKKRYDIANVEVYSTSAFLWAEVSAQLLFWLRKPFVLTLHGGGLPRLAERTPRRVRHLLQIANAVTTPSRYLQQQLRGFRSDIIYLPNGLNLGNYPFQLRKSPYPRLVWLRAFHEIYNPVMAIEVVSLLKEKFPDVHLNMIGPDKGDGSFEKAQKQVREKNLEEKIEFIGPISKEDVPAWLKKCDIFLNTTHLESFGVAVMEASAMGLPIVTTNVGELSYLWTDEHDAMLVPADDPEAMARAIHRILTEPGLAARLSANARSKVEQFDWSVILSRWEELWGMLKNQNESYRDD